MEATIVAAIESYGYFAVFALIFVENVFPPIPSEVILLLGGFFVGRGSLSYMPTVLSATLGSLIGAYVLYGIGRLIPKEKIYNSAERGVMKKLGFKKKEIVTVVDRFEDRGKLFVLFGRCVPVIRSLISIPAGMVKMPLPLFSVLTALGSFAWNCILTYLGYKTGENWHMILPYLDYYKYVIVAILAVLAVVYLIWHFKKKDE
ncbi:MAG: DedA family protein [Peptoniphilus sp.]|nr:DedA family protein [Peptoniphilus sp.]MDD7363112.1 DedA family protein [Bacillota bacterium]MDY6044366.1 DedA family protein [Peptoniphilus sp.]